MIAVFAILIGNFHHPFYRQRDLLMWLVQRQYMKNVVISIGAFISMFGKIQLPTQYPLPGRGPGRETKILRAVLYPF